MAMLKTPRPRVKKIVATGARGRCLAIRKKPPVFHAFNQARKAAPGETIRVRSGHPADCFVLKVVAGCSGFGISDGDYIIVQPADSPVHGRIVVVRGPSGMTLMGCDSGRMWSFRLKDGKRVEVPMPCGEVVIVGVVIERFGGVTEFRPSATSLGFHPSKASEKFL